jgi:hypothetical protein
VRATMNEKERHDVQNQTGRDRDDGRTPGEQPTHDDVPPIDDAPVPALTEPDDTEGG